MEASVPATRVKMFPFIWAALARAGVAPAEVARRAGLAFAVPGEVASVTIPQSFAFWGAVRELSGNPAIGLEIARNVDIAGAPPMFLAPFHARDWRDALHRLARYKQMCAPERLHFREEGDRCVIDLEWVRPHPERVTVTDLMFGNLMELGRRGTREPLVARRVELHRPAGDVAAHEAFFGCPVRFGAKASRLVVARADLERPFVSYNAELLELLSPAIERALADHQGRNTLQGQVKWLMKRRLATKRPDMHAIARELAVSGAHPAAQAGGGGDALPGHPRRGPPRARARIPRQPPARDGRCRLPAGIRRPELVLPRVPPVGGRDARALARPAPRHARGPARALQTGARHGALTFCSKQ